MKNGKRKGTVLVRGEEATGSTEGGVKGILRVHLEMHEVQKERYKCVRKSEIIACRQDVSAHWSSHHEGSFWCTIR